MRDIILGRKVGSASTARAGRAEKRMVEACERRILEFPLDMDEREVAKQLKREGWYSIGHRHLPLASGIRGPLQTGSEPSWKGILLQVGRLPAHVHSHVDAAVTNRRDAWMLSQRHLHRLGGVRNVSQCDVCAASTRHAGRPLRASH